MYQGLLTFLSTQQWVSQLPGIWMDEPAIGMIVPSSNFVLAFSKQDGVSTAVLHGEIQTPYGIVSGVIEFEVNGNRVVVIPRFGGSFQMSDDIISIEDGDWLIPEEVPVAASIFALKALGSVCCVSIGYVDGFFKSENVRGGFAFDIYNRSGIEKTFFGNGVNGRIIVKRYICEKLKEQFINITDIYTSCFQFLSYCKVVIAPNYLLNFVQYDFFQNLVNEPSNEYKKEFFISRFGGSEAELSCEAELPYIFLAFLQDNLAIQIPSENEEMIIDKRMELFINFCSKFEPGKFTSPIHTITNGSVKNYKIPFKRLKQFLPWVLRHYQN